MIVLGKYEIVEEVGRGGMGLVFKALDLRLGRTVALKELVIGPTIIGNERNEIVARFKQEAQTAASLNHPNIITVFDVGEENNRHFISMEFLPGKTLKDYLDEGHKYTTDEILDILIQIASGLEHAHSRGIVHRDIKPDNIKLLEANTVKITDFGIARIESSTNNLTQDGTMLGTLGYISPEQLHNSKGVDSRADIFSFGAMMYEIFTKKLPFDGGTVGSTILKIMTENPVAPRTIDPSIPESIEKLILKCLEKDPDKRDQKFKDIIHELNSIKFSLSNQSQVQAMNSTNPGMLKPLPPVPSENFGPPPVRSGNMLNHVPKPIEKPILQDNNRSILDKPSFMKDGYGDPKNVFQNSLRTTANVNRKTSANDYEEVTNYQNSMRTTFNNSLNNQQNAMKNQSKLNSHTPPPLANNINNLEINKDIRIAFVRIIGKIGASKGQFSAPRGLAVSPSNLVMVADTQNRRVQVFDSLGEWKYMIQQSDMQSPCDISFDNFNKTYVIDSVDCYIRVFDNMGNLITKFGGKGTNHGQFKSVSGISICNDRIYVTDTESYKVHVLNLSGQLQTVFGKYGTKPGEYKSPYSITVDENRVYVLDYGIPRVQVIDKNGISRLVFGERGTMKGQFSIPKGIEVDKFGRIYICDTLNHRIQVFDKSGKWIYTFGSKGNGNGQFTGPEAIDISDDGNIFVLDKGNSRVQVFTYEV